MFIGETVHFYLIKLLSKAQTVVIIDLHLFKTTEKEQI